MKKKIKILITGPVAPPAGGISIHIQRLQHLLQKEFDIDLVDESGLIKKDVFNIRSLNIFTYFKKVLASDLVYIHSGNKLFKKIHILTARLFAKKVIITLHGYGPKRKQPFRWIDNFFFGMAHKIILVNDNIGDRLSLPEKKCVVQHAFLPPVMEAEPSLPAYLQDWISRAGTKKQVIVCANASRLDLHKGEDLYGLDMAIEVARRMKTGGFPVSFIYSVSSLENSEAVFKKNLELVSNYDLRDSFLLINERLSFVKLIEKSDIVIRPTNADGDALTVREALYLGKYALASDVIKRPKGTVIFKTRDNDDLEEKLTRLVKRVLSSAAIPGEIDSGAEEDFKSFYFNLINSVVSK